MMKYVLLMKDTPVGPQVVDFGVSTAEELPQVAQVALEQGYDLMFECGTRPDMTEVVAAIKDGRGVSSLSCVDRLWKLG